MERHVRVGGQGKRSSFGVARDFCFQNKLGFEKLFVLRPAHVHPAPGAEQTPLAFLVRYHNRRAARRPAPVKHQGVELAAVVRAHAPAGDHVPHRYDAVVPGAHRDPGIVRVTLQHVHLVRVQAHGVNKGTTRHGPHPDREVAHRGQDVLVIRTPNGLLHRVHHRTSPRARLSPQRLNVRRRRQHRADFPAPDAGLFRFIQRLTFFTHHRFVPVPAFPYLRLPVP